MVSEAPAWTWRTFVAASSRAWPSSNICSIRGCSTARFVGMERAGSHMADPISVCRSCKNPELIQVLSLGCTPLANGLLTEEELADPEDTYPLELVFCSRCTLVQITETVSPEKLFRKYFYLSSFSGAFLQHAQQIATRLRQERNLNEHSLVIEVA